MTNYISQNAEYFAASMEKYGINTPQRIAHFLAQCAHESGGFKRFKENLDYTVDRLKKNFSKWREAAPYARTATKPANQKAIANIIYGGRNGNIYPTDGGDFIGRGLIQLTGRGNYQAYKNASGNDVINNPDLLLQLKYAIDSAAWFWWSNNLNKVADSNSVEKVTRAINGKKMLGLPERRLFTSLYLKQNITLDALKKKLI